MIRISNIVLAVLLSALVSQTAAAQSNVARFGIDRDRVHVTFGLDPALVTSVGYGHVIRVFDHDLLFVGDYGVAAARMDTRDFRVRVGTQTSLVRWGSLHLTGSATFITRGTENSIYHGLNFGSDFTGTFGTYRQGWFAAGEFGFDKAIVTHLTHTDWYRTYFYPDAKDGWYIDAGGTFHYGLAGGVSFGRTDLIGRFGWRRTEDFNELMPPIYVSAGMELGF
jgi:hypothetical protein